MSPEAPETEGQKPEFPYTCESLSDEDKARIVEDWGRLVGQERLLTLQSEIYLDRPVYSVCRDDTGEVVAFFDIQNTPSKNKNLQVFFSPEIVGQDGLTTEDTRRISGLLVYIFSVMVTKTEYEGMPGIKIHSHDKVLLSAFAGFADTLERLGYCSVKSYGNWIDVSDLEKNVISTA